MQNINECVRSACALVLLGSTGFSAGTVHAQSSDLPLEEVIVTAQKREENLREVPMAISVVSGERLDTGGYNSLLDAAKLTPAIAYVQSADPRTTTFSIRGIGSPGNIPGVEPSAAIIIDDETLARSAQMNYDIADIERVEVLKGPQGTLLGKNSSAGALNIVTRRPELGRSGGDVRLTMAADDETKVKANLNLALTEQSALRVNGFYNRLGGWVENVNPDQPNGGKEEGSGGRIQYLVKPTDNFSVLARAEYSEKTYGPYAQVINLLSSADLASPLTAGFGDPDWNDVIQPADYAAALAAHPDLQGTNAVEYLLLRSGHPLPLIDNTRTSQTGDRDYGKLRNQAFSVELSYDFTGSSLVYNGSYRDWQMFTNEDQDLIAIRTMPQYYAGDTNQRTSQHDLRWVSNGEGVLQYVAGLYNYRNTNYRSEHDQECYSAIFGFAVNQTDWTIDLTRPVRYNRDGSVDCANGAAYDFEVAYRSHIDTTNSAVYGQVDWAVTDALTLIAGARLLREEQTMYYLRPTGANPVPQELHWDSSDTAFIYKAGAKYSFAESLAYLTYSTGYKGVAWDNSVGRTATDFGSGGQWPIEPETPTQIELGLRTNWFDNRLLADLTAFHTTTEHFQAKGRFYNEVVPGGVVNQVIDAGDVLAKGVEAEFQFALTNSLRLSGAVAYLDASLQDDTYVACSTPNLQAGRCVRGSTIGLTGGNANRFVFNVKGQPLPSAPKWVYNVGASYSLALPNDYRAQVRAEYRHRSEEQFELTGDPFQTRQAFGVADLFLDLTTPGERYGVTLFVKNVLDELYFERSFEPTVNDYNSGMSAYLPRDYRRYVGLNLRASF